MELSPRLNGVLYKALLRLIKIRVLKKTKLRAKFFHHLRKIRRAEFGKKNPEKTFLVIFPVNDITGLFGLHNYVCAHVDYALKHSMIPIIDMKYVPNLLIDWDEIGKRNGWEHFFYQPYEDYSLEDVYRSKNVCFPSNFNIHVDYSPAKDLERIKSDYDICSKYIRVKPEFMKLADEYWNMNCLGTSVIGAVCRGTDYRTQHPHMHAKVPDNLTIYEDIMAYYKPGMKVFIATEDADIREYLIGKLGDKLLYTQKLVFDNTKKGYVADLIDEGRVSRVSLQEEYLVSILCLSKCDYLIGPGVGGTLGALRLNGGKYKDIKILDLGVYN